MSEPRKLLPMREIRARLGDVATRTVERRRGIDPTFPLFTKLNRRNYLFEDELERYLASKVERGAEDDQTA
jgi:hypothetical protein